MLGNCFNCLRRGHQLPQCRFKKSCYHCKKVGNHHRSLCPQAFKGQSASTMKRRRQGEMRIACGPPKPVPSRLCRTLSGSCPPPALGSRKADIKTLFFFSPAPSPTHITSARKQPSCPDIMVGRAACACALHPFLLCLEHNNGWVRWRTFLISTNTSK